MNRARVKFNSQIYDEASAWFVDCRAGDLDQAGRQEFDRWLRKSPEHLRAYLEIAAIWSEGPSLDPSRNWSADALIAEAHRDPENVVALQAAAATASDLRDPAPAAEAVKTVTRRDSARRLRFALAASVIALGALTSLWAWLALTSGIYSTVVGEQRSIELSDGSTVAMNSRSRIRVRYSNDERDVDLLEGQALFHVAKDKGRPFIVSASGTHVRAVGTQFDVYERRAGTVVTVLEGEVAVIAPSSEDRSPPAGESHSGNGLPAGPISVSAGEQLTITPKIVRKAEHANLATATAWTERRIVFESATLSEVAEEFNRYNVRQLIIQDPDLYDFHISGAFSSTDPESLIRFLRERPGVKVIEQGSEIRVSKNI